MIKLLAIFVPPIIVLIYIIWCAVHIKDKQHKAAIVALMSAYLVSRLIAIAIFGI